MDGLFPAAYAAFSEPILASFAQVTAVTKESDVAEAAYRARVQHFANGLGEMGRRISAGQQYYARPMSPAGR